MRKIKKSLALQVSLYVLLMVVLCAILVSLSSFFLYRNDSVKSNANRAKALAEATAAMIDGDALAVMMERGERTDYWYAVKEILDDTKMRTGVKYLYVLGSEYTDVMTYFAEGYDPVNDTEEEIDFGDQEAITIDGEATYSEELFDTLASGESLTSDVYESGDFGAMVTGSAAVKDSDGAVVGVVGVDISLEEVMRATNLFGLYLGVIIAVFCVVCGIVSFWHMNRWVGKPLGVLKNLSDRMAEGDVSVGHNIRRQDEVGLLAASFDSMARHTKEQAEALEELSQGNLAITLTPRSDRDLMSVSINGTLVRLNGMFDEVKLSSREVSGGADQIAAGAQTLASGATQQAATLQQFSAAIQGVLQQSEENARRAATAHGETLRTGSLMGESVQSMQQLSEAMREIKESSEKIAGVIKVVDDIAFQTNILALNAAVEAARAGQHGKGFAVVADEVRNLASKSAAAAKETAAMIEADVNKVAEGAKLAASTQETLRSVNEISSANALAMEEINRASEEQNRSIAEITRGIGDLSGVVQANSATAEQSAAAAEEMSSQAQTLNAIVARFRLRDERLLRE